MEIKHVILLNVDADESNEIVSVPNYYRSEIPFALYQIEYLWWFISNDTKSCNNIPNNEYLRKTWTKIKPNYNVLLRETTLIWTIKSSREIVMHKWRSIDSHKFLIFP